jgi:hypothetical protein
MDSFDDVEPKVKGPSTYLTRAESNLIPFYRISMRPAKSQNKNESEILSIVLLPDKTVPQDNILSFSTERLVFCLLKGYFINLYASFDISCPLVSPTCRFFDVMDALCAYASDASSDSSLSSELEIPINIDLSTPAIVQKPLQDDDYNPPAAASVPFGNYPAGLFSKYIKKRKTDDEIPNNTTKQQDEEILVKGVVFKFPF